MTPSLTNIANTDCMTKTPTKAPTLAPETDAPITDAPVAPPTRLLHQLVNQLPVK